LRDSQNLYENKIDAKSSNIKEYFALLDTIVCTFKSLGEKKRFVLISKENKIL
jgi:hypothetical protein